MILGRMCGILVAAITACVVLSNDIMAAEKTFGPFSVNDAAPTIITLNGEIDVGAALNFRRALQAAPAAKILTLNSGGGAVQMALLIADDVSQRRLATIIPAGKECYSACAYIFLAGIERQVDGELGVHQISSDTADLVSAQLSISDILEVLNRFQTPVEVMTVMFKTPPNEMHIFSSDEIARYKLNRKLGDAASDPEVSSDASVPDNAPSTALEALGDSAGKAPAERTSDNLSAMEEFTTRPTRMAVYTGLDLFGADIDSNRSVDAGECAKACLLMSGECKAFTFNADPKIVRGPNCFLKSSQGRSDGNSVAISGRFLSGAEPDPPQFSMGTIDPKTALFKDVDVPGGDLSSRPFGSKISPQGCRLACIDDSKCVAFTYMKRKHECWLKGSLGTPVYGRDMVSGLKKMETFAPAKIVKLD